MHKKYGKDGLVAISISLDELRDKDEALKFLVSKDAAFTNLLLDDGNWRDKLHFFAPPCYFVFNRQGKWVQFKGEDGPVDYPGMEKLVREFLKE
ncbi:MAG TPA: hypothetical protein VKE98_21580 [Gemmataceae bacterium]|nr:hypothetical protein [Gemmataceae bacterium]